MSEIKVAKLNEFGDVVCPNKFCNANIMKPVGAVLFPGFGKCRMCGESFKLEQKGIDNFREKGVNSGSESQ